MQRKLALVNRVTGGILNTENYHPFIQGDQERATHVLSRYRDRWYQTTSQFSDTILDIKEAL